MFKFRLLQLSAFIWAVIVLIVVALPLIGAWLNIGSKVR